MHVLFLEKLFEFTHKDNLRILTSQTERRILLSDAHYLSSGDIFEHAPVISGEISEQDWLSVVDYQQKWLSCLDWLFERLDDDWLLLINVPYEFFWSSGKEGKFYFQQYGAINTVEAIATKRDASEAMTSEKMLFPKGSIAFFRALNWFPTSSILKCTNCGKIFFNPTKRTMKYCSTKCRSAAGTKRFREKEGE